jgi:hypothetical protein
MLPREGGSSSSHLAGFSPLAASQLSLSSGEGGGLTAKDSGVQYVSSAWNSVGSGIAQQYFESLPMSAVDGEQASAVLQQARDNKERGSGKYPAYAARFWSPMGPPGLNT